MDLIDRQAAIDALMTDASYQMVDDWGNLTQDGEVILRVINELPSAEPRKGKWVKAERRGCISYSDAYAECSYCHGEPTFLGWWMNFCPNCGASMSEGEENND